MKMQLEYISNANNGIKGAAIGVENLLFLSELHIGLYILSPYGRKDTKIIRIFLEFL